MMTNCCKNISRRLVAGLAVTLAAGVPLGSPAQATIANVFKYAQPKTGFLMLGPADFAPDANDFDYSKGGGKSLRLTSSTQGCFQAAVHLPHLATVKQVETFYSRPAASDSFVVVLRRVNAIGTTAASVTNDQFAPARVTQGGSVTYAADPALDVISNQKFQYHIEVCIDNNARFFSARIDYTVTNAGD